MFEFHWKYKEFEIRSANTFGKGGNPYIELVKWTQDSRGKSYCFTLAFYKWDSEGGELIFVGDRPFTEIAEIDVAPIWKQLWLACGMLKDVFEKERND